MKYIVNLNGKSYEVEVEETEAVITSVTDAPRRRHQGHRTDARHNSCRQ